MAYDASKVYHVELDDVGMPFSIEGTLTGGGTDIAVTVTPHVDSPTSETVTDVVAEPHVYVTVNDVTHSPEDAVADFNLYFAQRNEITFSSIVGCTITYTA